MFHVKPPNKGLGIRLRESMARAGVDNEAVGKAAGVHTKTVSSWRRDKFPPDDSKLIAIARLLGVSASWLKFGGDEFSLRAPPDDPMIPRAEYRPGWPEGWQARTYRLALEASEKGATEEEVAVVRGWMMDPQLQLLWSGGAPADDRMTELDGIEIGARAWLRARGRMVKPR